MVVIRTTNNHFLVGGGGGGGGCAPFLLGLSVNTFLVVWYYAILTFLSQCCTVEGRNNDEIRCSQMGPTSGGTGILMTNESTYK